MASRSESSETDENAAGRAAGLRVLLVDDDHDTRDLLRFVLAQDAAGAAAVTIVLYVHRDTPPSRRAERNARQILGRIGEASVRFELRDVAEHPSEAEADRIVFVPTVVVKCTPPVWIVGDLRQPQALFDVLCVCGLARFEEFE